MKKHPILKFFGVILGILSGITLLVIGLLVVFAIYAISVESPMPWDYDAGKSVRQKQVKIGEDIVEEYLDEYFGGGKITMCRNEFYTDKSKYHLTDYVSGYFRMDTDPDRSYLFEANTVTGQVYHDYYDSYFEPVFEEKYIAALEDASDYQLADDGVHPYAMVPCTDDTKKESYGHVVYVGITGEVNAENVNAYLEKYLQGEDDASVRIKCDYSGTESLENCSLVETMKAYPGAQLAMKKYDDNDLIIEELEEVRNGTAAYRAYDYVSVNDNIFIKYQTTMTDYDGNVKKTQEFRVEEDTDGFKVFTDDSVRYVICFHDRQSLPNADLYCDNSSGSFGAVTIEQNDKIEYAEKEGSGKHLQGNHVFHYE